MGNLLQFRVKRNKKYSTVNLSCVEDKTLSWKAKGLHLYLMSRPPNWQVHTSELQSRSTDGLGSLRSGLKELLEKRYIYRAVERNTEGRTSIKRWMYLVFEKPTQKAEAEENLPEGYFLFIKNLKVKNETHTNNQSTKDKQDTKDNGSFSNENEALRAKPRKPSSSVKPRKVPRPAQSVDPPAKKNNKPTPENVRRWNNEKELTTTLANAYASIVLGKKRYRFNHNGKEKAKCRAAALKLKTCLDINDNQFYGFDFKSLAKVFVRGMKHFSEKSGMELTLGTLNSNWWQQEAFCKYMRRQFGDFKIPEDF